MNTHVTLRARGPPSARQDGGSGTGVNLRQIAPELDLDLLAIHALIVHRRFAAPLGHERHDIGFAASREAQERA